MKAMLLENGHSQDIVIKAMERVRANLAGDVSQLAARVGAIGVSAPQKNVGGEQYEDMKSFFDIYSTNVGSAAINTAMRNNTAIAIRGEDVVFELSRRHGDRHFEGRSGGARKKDLIATANTFDRSDMKKVANRLYKQSNETVGQFFRGQDLTSEGLNRFIDAIGSGEVFYSASPFSVTQIKAKAEEFMSGEHLEVLMEVKGFSASVMTSSLTARDESERVFSPHADFRVVNVGTRPTNSSQYLIKLEEVRAHKGARKVMPY
jgi:hypothetical protein